MLHQELWRTKIWTRSHTQTTTSISCRELYSRNHNVCLCSNKTKRDSYKTSGQGTITCRQIDPEYQTSSGLKTHRHSADIHIRRKVNCMFSTASMKSSASMRAKIARHCQNREINHRSYQITVRDQDRVSCKQWTTSKWESQPYRFQSLLKQTCLESGPYIISIRNWIPESAKVHLHTWAVMRSRSNCIHTES